MRIYWAVVGFFVGVPGVFLVIVAWKRHNKEWLVRLKRLMSAAFVAVILSGHVVTPVGPVQPRPGAGLMCDWFPWSLECWILSEAPRTAERAYPPFLLEQ